MATNTEIKNDGKYYFAYGRNMDTSVLRKRWNGDGEIINEIIGSRNRGVLSNHKLVFNKKAATKNVVYANIEVSENDTVEGILYYFKTDTFIECLDCHEGYPNHYNRKTLPIQKNDNTMVNAIVYIANPDYVVNGLKPEAEYICNLLAARDLLSAEYVGKLEKYKL